MPALVSPIIRTLVWLAALSAIAWAGVVVAQPVPVPYRVIVHPSSTLGPLERRYLGDVFLKKTTRWPNGDAILPVDLHSDARSRREFSEQVIGRSVASVKSYWQQILFAGRGLPPPELASDEAVVKYVLEHPGAIGYVSGDCITDVVKILAVK